MASSCPGMLLIPGTIVFKERITSETVADAIKSVQQAISPVRTPVAGVKSRNIPIKPYMTYEASDKTTTASKAHYEQSLEELSLFEKNKITSGSGGMKHSLGFEVCLDHSLGMLKEHMQAADLDLHVIASADDRVQVRQSQRCNSEGRGDRQRMGQRRR